MYLCNNNIQLVAPGLEFDCTAGSAWLILAVVLTKLLTIMKFLTVRTPNCHLNEVLRVI